MSDKKNVLMICLGNICRSPIAEAVFRTLTTQQGVEDKFFVDSAAIGPWHVGNPPDHRARSIITKYNLNANHRARQIRDEDFHKFDYIFGMDDENMDDLNSMKPKGAKAKLLLLGDFDPQKIRIIRDPYYDRGAQGFEDCYVQCTRCCEEFLRQVLAKEI